MLVVSRFRVIPKELLQVLVGVLVLKQVAVLRRFELLGEVVLFDVVRLSLVHPFAFPARRARNTFVVLPQDGKQRLLYLDPVQRARLSHHQLALFSREVSLSEEMPSLYG